MEALADRWTVRDRDGVGKTGRVEPDLPRRPERELPQPESTQGDYK